MIHEQIKKLSALYLLSNNDKRATILEQMENLIENYLAFHPNDIDMRIRLALTVWEPPLADDLKAIACFEEVIAQDPMNIKVLLMLAYIRDRGIQIDPPLLDKLERATSYSLDNEFMGMLYLAISWGYLYSDEHRHLNMLLLSVKYAPNLVQNQRQLGQAYLFLGKKELGLSHICHALKNIKGLDCQYPDQDITNIDEALNIFFRGIHISRTNFEMMINKLDPLYVDPSAHFYA